MPYAERFYRAAFYMLESQQDAEDAVQESFISYHSSTKDCKSCFPYVFRMF